MPGTRKLNRPTDQRKAMLRNLVTSFLENGRIETTLTRAKETQSMAEKMITLGKTNTLHSRRQALEFITKEDVVTKVFSEIALSTLTETAVTQEFTKQVLVAVTVHLWQFLSL